MIRLPSVISKLQLKLGSPVATNQLKIVVSYSDKTSSGYIGNSQQSTSDNTTLVDICNAPPQSSSGEASAIKDIDLICISNIDTAASIVYVYLFDNTGLYPIIIVNLSPGDNLEYIHGDGWKTIDYNGNIKTTMLTTTGGITSINGDNSAAQTLTIGTSGTNFNISDDGSGDHKFNLPVASASNTGKLSASDWSVFNGKEPAITAGTILQYWRGDKSWQTLNTSIVPELTNLYFTVARVLATALTGYVSGAGVISAADTVLSAIQKLNGNIAALIAGTVASVSGTVNRITSTGGTTPIIDISATFESLLGKVASPLSQFASTSSAQLAGVISDETGTGSLVFGTSPSLVTPNLGTPTAIILTNGTALPLTTGVTGILPIANGGTNANNSANARTNLGLGDSATKNVGTTAGTVAAGDDDRFGIVAIITADQTNTLATNVNITDFILPLKANSVYLIEGVVHIGCSGVGGVKFATVVPASTTFYIGFQGRGTASTNYLELSCSVSGTLTTSGLCQQVSNNAYAQIIGTIRTGATAGNLQIQFASGTAGQTSTIYMEGSFLRAQKS